MESNTIDWLIWEIMMLKRDILNHHHTSVFTSYTPSNRLCNEHESTDPRWILSNEIQQLNERKEELNQDATEFTALKNQICFKPCPIEAIRKELTEISTQLPELERQREALVKKMDKNPNLRNKILDELRSQSDKEQK